jgi:hypothetical protein
MGKIWRKAERKFKRTRPFFLAIDLLGRKALVPLAFTISGFACTYGGVEASLFVNLEAIFFVVLAIFGSALGVCVQTIVGLPRPSRYRRSLLRLKRTLQKFVLGSLFVVLGFPIGGSAGALARYERNAHTRPTAPPTGQPAQPASAANPIIAKPVLTG